MIEHKNSQGLSWVQFNSFSGFPIQHGFFQRDGGVSPDPWKSLNLGGGIGDIPQNTIENKSRMLSAFGIRRDQVYDVWQVHSTEVITALTPRMDGDPYLKADGIITDQVGLALVMRFADCVPILVYDPNRHVVGIGHAGWKGTVNDMAGALITGMEKKYNCRPSDLVAGIGPSICQSHYQVGSEVIDALSAKFSNEEIDQVTKFTNNSPHLDLWKTNQIFLQRAGVLSIEVAGMCTACETDKWFSHRGENGKTGRFGAVIQLE